MAITKQKFITIMKRRIEEKNLSKLDAFFGEEWSNNKHSPLTHGNIIIIPKNTALKNPIILEFADSKEDSSSLNLILAEQGSKAKVVLNKTGRQSAVQDSVRVIAHKNAQIEIIDISIDERSSQSEIITNLAEPGAEAKITSLFFGKQKQKGTVFTAAIHNAPFTKSDITTRSIVTDRAKVINRGLIRINENAAHSSGYQKQDALILSEESEADAVPNLEIHNHDVKCSHGSTIGQIDEEQLFYLMSRGLDRQQAKQKIIEGYFTPLLNLIDDSSIKEKINNSIEISLDLRDR